MQDMICTASRAVARALGCGHSEKVYQKALSVALQKMSSELTSSGSITHALEYHVPVMYDGMAVGSERVDLVLRDDQAQLHVVELKAVESSLRRGRNGAPPTAGTALPAPHVQLLKYLRMLWTREHVVAGYVINFRQRLLHADTLPPLTAPCELEMDCFDVATQTWQFDLLRAPPDDLDARNTTAPTVPFSGAQKSTGV